MRIFIFGSTGMLGKYVSTYFENEGYDVIRFERKDYDLSTMTYKSLSSFLNGFVMTDNSIIINCAGIIHQRIKNAHHVDYYKINGYFPKYLAKYRKETGINIIHASTDCVFSGSRSNYSEDDLPDAMDVYGFTKAMGEDQNNINIRCSIIGEELKNKVSFLEFVRELKGETIYGFTDQIWNGITCLEWAKQVRVIVDSVNETTMPSIIHLPSNVLTKYELIKLINEIYDLNSEIRPIASDNAHDKSLVTNHKWQEISDIKQQLQELKEFKLR